MDKRVPVGGQQADNGGQAGWCSGSNLIMEDRMEGLEAAHGQQRASWRNRSVVDISQKKSQESSCLQRNMFNPIQGGVPASSFHQQVQAYTADCRAGNILLHHSYKQNYNRECYHESPKGW